jgi:hypothetical protein
LDPRRSFDAISGNGAAELGKQLYDRRALRVGDVQRRCLRVVSDRKTAKLRQLRLYGSGIVFWTTLDILSTLFGEEDSGYSD